MNKFRKEDYFAQVVDFLDSHPKVGVVGPKVLNAAGSFLPQCRNDVL